MVHKTKKNQKEVSKMTPKSLNSQKGFTLIEMAIVLVIIGLILGAVLKGQDLIQNARIKKFITDAGKKFEVAAWTVYDRTGKFPGDANGDGIIGDGNATADINNANLNNPPINPVNLGSYSFYVFYGNDGGTNPKNVIIICRSSDCNTKFDAASLQYLKSFDTTIDGVSDGTDGNVVGVNTTPTNVDYSSWEANGTITYGDWTAGTTVALQYYFDAKP